MGARDHRIDLVRGFALLTIFIDHIPGNVLDRWTLRNFALCDATEVFVLLAGLSVALAYGRAWGTDPVGTSIRIWRRAGAVYTAQLACSIVGLSLILVVSSLLGREDFLRSLGGSFLYEDPLEAIGGLATMGYQVGYLNILPMYVILLVATPLVVLGVSLSPRWTLAASIGIWALSNSYGIDIPTVDGHRWYFDPFAWQLLFVIGAVWGGTLGKGRTLPRTRLLDAVALAYLGGGCVYVMMDLWGSVPTIAPEPLAWLQAADKTNLTPNRLLSILALGYLATGWGIPAALGRWTTPGNALAAMGRHSLPIFCIGTLLSLLGGMMREALWARSGMIEATLLDAACVVVGAAMLVTLARVLDLSSPNRTVRRFDHAGKRSDSIEHPPRDGAPQRT